MNNGNYVKPEGLGFFGPPGAGKDTHQEEVLKRFPGAFYVIGTGQMLRDTVKQNVQPLAGQVDGYLKAQVLVPDDIMNPVVKSQTEYAVRSGRMDPRRQRIIYNGFPRTEDQARFLDEQVAKMSAIVYLSAEGGASRDPYGELVDRIYNRALKAKGQGKEYRPGDLDRDAVYNRMREFQNITLRAVEYFRGNGTPVYDIPAVGRSLEDVQADVLDCVDATLQKKPLERKVYVPTFSIASLDYSRA